MTATFIFAEQGTFRRHVAVEATDATTARERYDGGEGVSSEVEFIIEDVVLDSVEPEDTIPGSPLEASLLRRILPFEPIVTRPSLRDFGVEARG